MAILERSSEHEQTLTPAVDVVIAALAGLVALLVRLPAALSNSFPLNDGGLFFQMILDLQANSFRLPAFTSYNAAHIPFAYPPIGLYVAALLSSATHADVLDILRIVPPLVSSLSVPAFYFLARRLLNSQSYTVLAATFAFALIPRAFEWQIMGGGITRAFGFLFALLTWCAAYDLFRQKRPIQIIPTALWGSLTVLSHPEAALQCLVGALLLYLVLDRSRKGAVLAVAVALAGVALTTPWWATVVTRYGTDPFMAAIAAARQGTTIDVPARIFLTFQFSFTEEPFLPLIAVLGLIGLFAELARRRWLLPLWVTLPLLIEPRSAPQYMVVPLGMLAGIGVVEIVIPAIRNLGAGARAAQWLAAYLAVYSLLGAYLVPARIADNASLQPADRAAFAWVRANTPRDGQFVVLTGANALADPWAEWFPALAQRRSLDTIFGSEWLARNPFGKEIQQYDALQRCLVQDTTCLRRWRQATGQNFDYVAVQITDGSAALLASLRASPAYDLVYETQTFAIFAVRQSAALAQGRGN